MPDFNPNKSKLVLMFDGILFLLFFLIVGSFCVSTAFLIYQPDAGIFLVALVPKAYRSSPLTYFIIIHHIYVIFLIHLCFGVLASTIVSYGFYFTPFYLFELNLEMKKYKTVKVLRTPEVLRMTYRALEVFQANAFYLLGPVLAVYHSLLMSICLFCNAVLIRYWGTLSTLSKSTLLIWTLSFLTFWSFVLELGKYSAMRGERAILSWKSGKWGPGEKKIMQRFGKSCKPILLSYGTQFVISRKSLLRFFRGIVRGTFRTLLTSKNRI